MPERYVGRHLGRFRIDELIGAGGFAWVYRGWDPELDIPVAVKVLKPHFAGDEGFEARFRREALTASHLRHPNIIRILGVGRDGDAVFFAMDYLPHNLTERLRLMRVLPEPLLARVGVEVAAALAFAHREGVVHRDVKTDNMLFDEHGNAIVADFGIARASSVVSEDTATNMVVGTPQYFSPEQARGLPLDGRSDIYSLGVTLYRAATGALPFTGDDWYDIARQQIEEPARAPRELNPELTPGFERVILRCLEKKPAKRYDSADALRIDLLALGNRAEPSETSTEMYVHPVATAPRGMLTRTRVAWGAAAVAIVLLVASSARGRQAPAVVAPFVQPTKAETTSALPPLVIAPRVESIERVDSPRSPASPRLIVRAPESAEVFVDARSLGRGDWRGESVAGVHWIVASVTTLPGCSTARDSQRVTLVAGRSAMARLEPRACGSLAFDVKEEGARYTITVSARTVLAGLVSSEPLTLPVGTYQLRVSKPLCADYSADITIGPEKLTTQHFTLMC